MKLALSRFSKLIALCILLLLPQSASAFYGWQTENSSIEVRGLLRGSAAVLKNPDNQIYYHSNSVSGLAASGRLMIDAGLDGHFSFEMHAVQNYIPMKLQSGGSNLVLLQGSERSDLLEWSYDKRRAHLLLDRLNFQYDSSSLNLKIGRQPINLASTFFFTPNDFFAPFAAQTFFRSYKPGVDATREDIQMAELSQISPITVLGYHTDAGGDNGWRNRSISARNAYLYQTFTMFSDF